MGGGIDLRNRDLGKPELLQAVGAQQAFLEVVVVEHVPLLGVRERDLLRPELEDPRRQELDDDAVVPRRELQGMDPAVAHGVGHDLRRRLTVQQQLVRTLTEAGE